MQRLLVTGGSGFIGGAIARQLIAEGDEVLVTGTQSERVPHGAELIPVNFTGLDWERLGKLDAVIHQAAINDTTWQDRRSMIAANVEAPIVLFERAYRAGCRRFVYASSTAVYGNAPAPYVESITEPKPLNPYAESKFLFEQWATEFAIGNPDANVVGLRYCNVYGPGEAHKGKRASMIGQLIKSMQAGNRPALFKHGEQVRDWIEVSDVVRANLAAMRYEGSDIFNCGSGTASSFNQIVKLINEKIGTNLEPIYIDNPYAAAYQSHTQCDMTKARELLGFIPLVDLRAGIQSLA